MSLTRDITLTFTTQEFELFSQFYAAICDRGALKAIESYNYGVLFEKIRKELQKAREESKTAEEAKTKNVALTFSPQDFDIFLQFYSATCERGALKAAEAYNYGVLFEKIREEVQKAVQQSKPTEQAKSG